MVPVTSLVELATMSFAQHSTSTHLQAPDEVIEMPGHCMACNGEAVTRVFQTSIPYFKVHFFTPAAMPSGSSFSPTA